jgi:hypothetical protein
MLVALEQVGREMRAEEGCHGWESMPQEVEAVLALQVEMLVPGHQDLVEPDFAQQLRVKEFSTLVVEVAEITPTDQVWVVEVAGAMVELMARQLG